jgi:hypothetical protein
LYDLPTGVPSPAVWRLLLKEAADAYVWSILDIALEDLGCLKRRLSVCLRVTKKEPSRGGLIGFGLDNEEAMEVN